MENTAILYSEHNHTLRAYIKYTSGWYIWCTPSMYGYVQNTSNIPVGGICNITNITTALSFKAQHNTQPESSNHNTKVQWWAMHNAISMHVYSATRWECSTKLALTGGNWQKWKRVFLTCPCHKIYRDEAVGLKSCKYTWKITKFVKMRNLGQYRENLIFCQ